MAGFVAVGGLALLSAPGQAADPGAPTAAFDPPVLVSATQAARETSLALSPTDPRTMVICDPSGVPNTGNGQSYFHRTTDGGATWAKMNVETSQTDTRKFAFEGGDCDVATDAAGTIYSADTWLGDLSIGHSTDSGVTWDGTAISGTSPVIDRPWMVGGPAGTLYVSYQDLQCCTPAAMWFMKSTDYGKTFTPAVPITTAGPGGAYTWEGNFVVRPGGQDLFLVYTRRSGGAVSVTSPATPAGETVWVAASHDGGATWTSNLVTSTTGSASYLYPSIGIDAAGWLHVVYSSARATDLPVWYAFSKDGVSWTTPTPLSPGTAGVGPWVAGGAPGEAAVAFLGSTDPKASGSTTSPWYFGWAKVRGADTATPSIGTGFTTTKPLFTGKQTTPEFEMVRLDADGKMHLGMSIFKQGATAWNVYYQRESAG